MTERVSQVEQEILESYVASTNIRASQVVVETLESYSNPTRCFASQVVLEVLRDVTAATPITTTGAILLVPLT